jgi:acetyltransferase
VLRVNELDDIFHMTEVLAHQPRPAGPNLAIVTNAGGPGVLAADMAIGLGEQLASLAPATTEALNHVLPRHWSHNNPVDILGDADPARYAAAIKIVADDPNVDGLLVIMSPQAVSDPLQIAQKVAPFAHLGGKPILASWMGGARATEGEAVLNKAGIPTFPFPDSAVRAFHYMWRYSYNLNALYETPTLADNNDGDAAKVTNLIEAARRSGRELLTEHESKVLLEAYSIPTAETRLAHSVEEAVEIAEEIGFPVVLKLHSFTITHKSETGGVQLNLRDEAEVRRAFGNIRTAVWSNAPEEHFEGVTVQPMIRSDGYELIVGSMVDPQFGPVLLFGTGGRLVEVFRDRALALPPLNTTLARRFMEQTRIFDALNGTRGNKPADVKALEALLVRFSRLVLEQPFIKEIDINPLLASPDGLLALDARVVLWPQSTDVASIPKAPIRLYPLKYIDNDVTLKNGTKLVIRPIRPEDEPALARFHSTLSDESVYRRYFTQIKLESRIRHERLTRLCFIDYDRQMGLVAEKPTSDGTPAEIIGIGRLVKSPLESEAEVAAVISDEYQRMGLGRALVSRLLQFARDEKIERLSASVLSGNPAMERLLEGQGFAFAVGSDPDVLEGEMQLFGS